MSAPEPIAVAIVGLSCRFPGGADTPDKLWEIVSRRQQCWSPVPPSRYNEHAFHHPDPDARGTHNARGGFFLAQDVAAFDAPFFSIPAAEATAMDPQQRLLLEVTYEALENAGHTLDSIRGTQTGVYVALVSRDYDRQIYKDPMCIPKHHLTGCGDATACGRISYVFDLRGPSLSLDTGCSGGMAALHLACQALRSGEAESAIVGGTNLLLGPDMTIAMSALHMINDNGRCYPLDSRGAGYGRAEGVAALVVKRLSDAVRDGDPIRAVIRNTGVNQDGKTNGILLPNSDAQRDLAASLYRQAGLNPRDVCYVEAHGTGTQAGDAAEVTSIKSVFSGDARSREHPLFLGSIKANIGHSESTSGLAGVIKTVLALEKAVIPPLAGLKELKPDLVPLLEGSGIVIPQEPQPWPHQGTRLASVNSFGFGGTNAHVILQSAPEVYTNGTRNGCHSLIAGPRTHSNGSTDAGEEEKPLLFVLSARSKSSLERTIRNVRDWCVRHSPTYSQRQQLAKTLAQRRSIFKWRSAITAASYDGLLSALKEPRLSRATANPTVALIFTGQGSQYARMGRELIHQNNNFSRSIQRSQQILIELGASWRLVDELLRDESFSRINSSELSQPATTAIQVALVDLLTELNVLPSAVLGHSSGEVAAAYAAGILDHKEALTIAYHKGFVAGWCKETCLPGGGMLAVGLGEAKALEYVQRGSVGRCTVACINSPSSVTLSGDELAIAEVQKMLNQDSVFNRRLKVDIAYHSHHMAVVSDRFHQCVLGVSARRSKDSVRFFSSVTGSHITDPLGPSYWVNNLVSQVRFAPALEEMVRVLSNCTSESLVLLEMGPHSALQGPIRQTMMNATTNPPAKWSYTPSLIRNRDAHLAALEMVGSLFEQGVSVRPTTDVSSQPDPGKQSPRPVLTDLPPYPWDHSDSNHYWHESRLSKEYRFRSHPPHDLCGLRLTGTSTIEPVFRHILSVDDLPWLQEHIIDGFALYPGSAFLCMGIEALRQVSRDRGEKREIAKFMFRDVSFSKALVVPDSPGSVEVLLSLRPSRADWEEFRISSVGAEGGWSEHCKGDIRAEFQTPPTETEDEADPQSIVDSISEKHLASMRQTCDETLTSTSIYAEMRKNGIDYGDSFSIIREMHLGDHKALGHLRIPDIKRTMPSQHMQPHIIHPAVFDAFMHVVLPLYHRHCSQGPVMLTSIGEVSVSADILNAPGSELVAACELTRAARRHGSVDVAVFQFDAEGKPVEIASLSREDFRAIGERASEKVAVDLAPPCYHLDWVPASLDDSQAANGNKANLHDVNVSFLSETPLALELANGVRSYLLTSGDEDDTAGITNGEMARSSSIHIVFTGELKASIAAGNLLSLLRNDRSLLLVTIFAEHSSGMSAAGLARVARQEIEDAHIVSLDYQDILSSDRTTLYQAVTDVLHRSRRQGNGETPVDHEYRYQDGHLLVPRLELDTAANQWLTANVTGEDMTTTAAFHSSNQPLELHFTTPGLFDSAVFVPLSNTPALGPNEVSVKVYAHGVNALDVSIALDRAEPTSAMMGEFAGIVVEVGDGCRDLYQPGDRVCGWGAPPYTNIAVVKGHLVHRLEGSTSFAEGASIPVAFLTAMYALDTIASLEDGQTVLIHGVAGDVGQAAISIAQHIGAGVYATVASHKEKESLGEQAGIPRSRIFYTSSTSFKDEILHLTGGRGVDVILDCSSGGLFDESVPLVADFGYVIDVANSRVPQTVGSRLQRNVTFASVNLQLLAARRPKQVEKLFSKVVALYQAAKLRPIAPLATMNLRDVGTAFRLVQSQRHLGKIVLESDETAVVKQVAPQPRPPVLAEDGIYAVVGGSPPLNHALCTFLEERGARQILSVLDSNADTRQGGLDFSRFQQVKIDNIATSEDLSSVLSHSTGASLRGILYVEWVADGRSLTQITDEELHASTTKIHDTKAAGESIAASTAVDFSVTLAPCAAILGCQGHALSAAGSTVNGSPTAHSVTVRLDAIDGIGTWNTGQASTAALKLSELYSLLDYTITAASQLDNEKSRELFTGLTKATCPRANPIFKAIHELSDETITSETQLSSKRIDQQIASAESMAEVYRIVLDAAVQQLSSFLALDADDISENMSIASLGLDSLLAIEFKNWLVRTTQAPVQTSEVLDASSLKQLVEMVMKRSKLVLKTNETSDVDAPSVRVNGTSNGDHLPHPTINTQTPPPLPIPSLESLIERHLSYLRAHATDAEYRTTRSLAADFQAPGGIGRRLYDRLKAIRAANPKTWYHDLYLRNQYLVRNGSLAPYMTFFFTHPVDVPSHSQAERAALMVSTVIRYKDKLEKGLIRPRVVNEEPLCMDLYKYLFCTTREPTVGVDRFVQYPGCEHFVVLRRGQAYKVELDQVDRLEQIFDRILLETDTSEVDWLGILTTDDRISWAKTRQAFIEHSPENAAYIRTIEESAFVVSLDDSSPETSEERGRHFHFSDGSNRWHDKPIHFIITANGASGILGDHTGLDAATVHDLNTEIADAIRRHRPRTRHTNGTSVEPDIHTSMEHLRHAPLAPSTQSRINGLRTTYTAATCTREHRYPPPLAYGSTLMQRHKIPANSAIQLLVQLAGRYYFGSTLPCWETVLQSNFATGRVEINQVVSVQVAAFVDAAVAVDDHGHENKASLRPVRKLFVEAARAHSASVLACTRAGGSDRFLSMLREIVDRENGEEEPGLFHDPVYIRARPRKFVSNCFPTGMAENGCVLRDEEGVWLHFEVEPERVKFSIVGPAGQTERFGECLVRAAERVRDIVEAV
ncbi:hypothetical protein ASPCAL00366 [Aspergillus calidoustus]|uniref:Uncharacterized protein n=1 Tax=Aspergillus calidoustus TaxID=454130 RepID=A0A0U5FMT1_ASPCI|nr:hypothetical protein ASPCAL00366 [Aspergillus calidoustus]